MILQLQCTDTPHTLSCHCLYNCRIDDPNYVRLFGTTLRTTVHCNWLLD